MASLRQWKGRKYNAMNDSEYVQDLIDRGGDICIPAVNPRTGASVYTITTPLVLHSGCHVTLDGCTLRLADGVYSNLFISEGAWDAQPSEVRDIALIGRNGAMLDGGRFNGLTERTAGREGRPSILQNTFILLRYVRGFWLEGLHFQSPRYWNMTFYYCSEGVIREITFDSANDAPNQDGIDLRRGCHHISIEDIRGSTGDDTVALTALWHPIEDCFSIDGLSPDVHDIIIRHVHTEVTGHHGIIRLLCHDGIRMQRIEIEDIYDCLMDTGHGVNLAAVRLGDANYWTQCPAKVGDMDHIRIRGVVSHAPTVVKMAVEIPDLVLTDICRQTTKGDVV